MRRRTQQCRAARASFRVTGCHSGRRNARRLSRTLTRHRHIAEYLLHVGVLVPELLHARQQRRRAIPQIACAIDVLVPHLRVDVRCCQSRCTQRLDTAASLSPRQHHRTYFELGVLEPQHGVACVDAERTLHHGARALRLSPWPSSHCITFTP